MKSQTTLAALLPRLSLLQVVRRLRRLVSLTVFFGLFSGVGLLSAQANDLILAQTAPPLTLHTLDGASLTTESLRGQVVIVTFWATWCEPCLQELPILSAYAAAHQQDGLRVLGFSLDDAETLPQVRQMAQKLSFPVGLLGSAYAGGYGRIWRCPVSFVIDRKGDLVYNGWDDKQAAWTEQSLQRIVAPLLHPDG